MESKPTLDVMIATHGPDGLSKVASMTLPAVEGVRYLVGCQSKPYAIPSKLSEREDVEIHFTDSTGLSANRNFLLGLSTAPLGLIADNDLNYTSEGIESVIKVMDENPDIDIATFRFRGAHSKDYPPEKWNLQQRFKNYFVSSVEISIRANKLKREGIRFEEKISTGTSYIQAGEENLFIRNALRRGLKGCFFPITICSHEGTCTIKKNPDKPGVLRAKGMTVAIESPLKSIPRLILYSFRTPGSSIKNFAYMMQGWWYALKNWRNILVPKKAY